LCRQVGVDEPACSSWRGPRGWRRSGRAASQLRRSQPHSRQSSFTHVGFRPESSGTTLETLLSNSLSSYLMSPAAPGRNRSGNSSGPAHDDAGGWVATAAVQQSCHSINPRAVHRQSRQPDRNLPEARSWCKRAVCARTRVWSRRRRAAPAALQPSRCTRAAAGGFRTSYRQTERVLPHP
jgi:hypothetical protein